MGVGADFTTERREPLQVNFVDVTPETVDKYFPNYRQEYSMRVEDDMARLRDGRTHWCLALDPQTGLEAGGIFINCEESNGVTLRVGEPYQRRGVAKQLIRHVQERYEHLELQNAAEEVGMALYTQMGFVGPDDKGVMVWNKK